MWSDVEDQLQDVLCLRFYPAISNDRRYSRFLTKAGLAAGPRDWSRLTGQLQMRLDQQARHEAHAVTRALAIGALLGETSCQATIIAGPARLYRLGELWFPEELLAAASEEAGPEGRLRWLRTFLNSPGSDDRIVQLQLPPAVEIPAIQDIAWPRRRFSRESWRHPKLPNYKYWGAMEERFPEGMPRAVLPYLPEERLSDWASRSSD